MIIGAGLLSGCAAGGAGQKPAQGAAETEEFEAVAGEGKAPAQAVTERQDIYVFIAASLKNTMEEIKADYEAEHPGVNILYNADSSGTLQTQIEEGAQCDIFFSAAAKQMDALTEAGLIADGSVTNLLENKIVLIKPKGGDTAVTGFDNITEASSLALAGEDVPVGQYARTLFENLGILDEVMSMEINEGANVTAVLAAVAEGSNEVGVVYATDAASMPDAVEIIAEAGAAQVDPAIYPVGLVICGESSEAETEAAKAFLSYLTGSQSVMDRFTAAGFSAYAKEGARK